MKIAIDAQKSELEFLKNEIQARVDALDTKQVSLAEAQEWLERRAFLSSVVEQINEQLKPKGPAKKNKEKPKTKAKAKQ